MQALQILSHLEFIIGLVYVQVMTSKKNKFSYNCKCNVYSTNRKDRIFRNLHFQSQHILFLEIILIWAWEPSLESQKIFFCFMPYHKSDKNGIAIVGESLRIIFEVTQQAWLTMDRRWLVPSTVRVDYQYNIMGPLTVQSVPSRTLHSRRAPKRTWTRYVWTAYHALYFLIYE